jgi:hypothetical protein
MCPLFATRAPEADECRFNVMANLAGDICVDAAVSEGRSEERFLVLRPT